MGNLAAVITGTAVVSATLLGGLPYVLQDSSNALWQLSVNDSGILSTTSVASGYTGVNLSLNDNASGSWLVGVTTSGLLTTTSIIFGGYAQAHLLLSTDESSAWNLSVTTGGLLVTTQVQIFAAVINGTSSVSATGGTSNVSAIIFGTSVVSASLNTGGNSISAAIFGTSQVSASLFQARFRGWAPNWLFGQQDKGLAIYVSPGSVNKITLFNGGVVQVQPNTVTYVWTNTAGQILTGATLAAGTYPIAMVTAGQVRTGGNTPAGLITPLGQWGGVSYDNGVLSILDLRQSQ